MGTRSYLFGEGINNLKKHGSKTFSTMLIICATMLLLGIFLVVYINVQVNAKVITENQGLQAFISDDVSEKNISNLTEKIKAIGNVKSVTYINKEEAFLDAKNTLKDYEYLLDGLETVNPFPRSFIIIFENLENTVSVKEAVESVEGIYRVGYNESIINAVISFSKVGGLVMMVVGIIMVVVSIFIIANTIKLSVYSNKREIYIMKYVGATSSFINAPFVISGIGMGIISALVSWVILSLAYIGIYSKAPQLGAEIGTFGFVAYSSIWYYILGAFFIVGVILGGIGSVVATSKYLKEFKPVKISTKEKEARKATERLAKREEDERKRREKEETKNMQKSKLEKLKQEKRAERVIKKDNSHEINSKEENTRTVLSRKEARRHARK